MSFYSDGGEIHREAVAQARITEMEGIVTEKTEALATAATVVLSLTPSRPLPVLSGYVYPGQDDTGKEPGHLFTAA